MPQLPLIHEEFERAAAAHPERVALKFGKQQLSYRKLEEGSRRVACGLRARGVGKKRDDLVGLFIEPSLDMIIGVLGILRAGGTYVPLDTTSPQSRLGLIVEDAAPCFVLTQEALKEVATGMSALSEAVTVEALSATELGPAPDTASQADDLAYIIYTSGTTGRPKGVMNTHRNVTRLLSETADWYKFNETDVIPLFHSIAFDVSVWELWTALCHGACLVVVSKEAKRNPATFRALLVSAGVTVLNQTPSAFQMLVAEELKHQFRLPKLRAITFAGEKLLFFKLRPWVELYGTDQPKLINMYGITETCVHVTYYEVTTADVEVGIHSRIGVPIPDLKLHILNEDMTEVAAGTEGELYVEGPGVGRGYFKREELSAQRFVANPFGGTNPLGRTKLYRSGDIVKMSLEGHLEYIGRNDHQVKIRGFRIELAEIERAMLSHPAVDYAVVRKVDERLVGWFAPKAADLQAVRAHVRGEVPDYMVPLLLGVDEIPLNTNGKADVRALQEMKRSSYSKGGAPQTDAQRLIADVWKSELSVEQIGTEDNYFDLGGDSIRALRMQAKVQAAGYEFSIETLYKNPTVMSLAASLWPLERTERVAALALISEADREQVPAGVVDAYPMSSLQRGMLYEAARQPGYGVYNDVYSYCVLLPLVTDKLAAAVQEMIRRHPVARTSLHLSGFSLPMQCVHESALAGTTHEDLSELDRPAAQRRVCEYLAARKDFDWDCEKAPLVHFHSQRLSAAEFQLHFSFHHAVLDGWSLSAFLTELVTIYKLSLDGQPSPAAVMDCSFADYIALEAKAAEDSESRVFWQLRAEKINYEPVPSRGLPSSAYSGEIKESQKLAHLVSQENALATAEEKQKSPVIVSEVEIAEATSARLTELAAQWNVPLHILLLAVHFRVLGVLYGRRTLVTGVVTNGRPERQGADQLLGLFLNVLPLRITLHPEEPWKELCGRLMADYQEMLGHRRFPLTAIQTSAGGRLFDAVFNFVEFHVYSHLEQVAKIDWSRSLYFEANELTLIPYFIVDTSGRLLLRLYGSSETFSNTELRAAGDHYARALTSLAELPHGGITGKSVLSPAERDILTGALASGGGRKPAGQDSDGADGVGQDDAGANHDGHVHSRFMAQCRARPDAIALEAGDRRLTYAELDARAETVAHALAEQGIQEGSTVALGLSRSPEMVIAVIACLRLGACYVPVDPSYPQERIDLLVRDSAPEVMLTERRFTRTGRGGLPMVLVDRAGKIRGLRQLVFDDLNGEPPAGVSYRDRPLEPEKLAYVIYTSGSTGKPKGVQITRQNIATLVGDYLQGFPLQAGDRMHQSFAFGFDGFQLEILPALSAGVCLVFVEGGEPPPRDITAMTLTPSLLSVRSPDRYPLLRLLGIGGEALTRAHLRGWFREGRRVFNLYGPTECTIASTLNEIFDDDKDITIGKPLASYSAYIVSELDELSPRGVPGELCIAGPGLACGYLHRPEEDAAHFTEHPALGGQRIYRTGDTVSWNQRGELAFYGRRDGQVKLRGFRIELGEIEATLAEHDSVKRAVVVLYEGVLAAFLQPSAPLPKRATQPAPSSVSRYPGSRRRELADSRALDADFGDLKSYAEKHLPVYMRPSAWLALDSFPADGNGKVDRRALEQYVPTMFNQEAMDAAPPRDTLEIDLLNIFRELLPGQSLGVSDDFFACGGDSLKAIQLLTSIERHQRKRLTLAQILESPTAAGLAERLRGGASSPLVRLQPQGEDAPFFCVHPALRTAFCYRELAQAMGEARPFYGIEAIDAVADATTLQDLAGRYVTEIRTLQPVGPYHLGGWSAGGNIALAIAQQLEAAGESVAALCVFDSRPPSNVAQHELTCSLHNDSTAALCLVARLLERMSGKLLGDIYGELKAVPESQRAVKLRELVERAEILPAGSAQATIAQYEGDLRWISGLVVDSRDQPLPQKMTLFVAEDPEPAADGTTALDDVIGDRTLGWNQTDIDVEYVMVQGSHQSMVFAPDVASLASALKKRLAETR
ncbi:MAG: amino acid adenylation domain-containing protein [Polyangiaceae bacterium]|nr:amino acid adenylation domain-containing protein [Polyangiaceae bacterium]